MISLEDKIFEYSKALAEITNYSSDYSAELSIGDGFFIKATHLPIENGRWEYNIAIRDDKKIIDSIDCNNIQEDLEDVIIFLIEEYVLL